MKNITNRTGIVIFFVVLLIGGVALLAAGYIIVNKKYIGKPCGGFAANIPEYQCPSGLRCTTNDSYPDASGQCQYIWPLSLLISKTYQQQTNNSDTKTSNTETGTEGQFCGGFANIFCPEGYTCKLEGNYPDAGGKCVKR